ncbi:Ribosomal RNA small subunit methyltransferase F [Dickeya solani]|nr:Ribosomal RNA small subunit methyltransferase F [Dickeya solani]
MLGKMRFSRMGVKLAERFAKGYRWQHEAVVALGNPDNPNTYPLSAEQVVDWFRGKDIYPPSPVNHDEVLLTWQQTTLGLTKRVGQRLKNTLPRDLVRDGANLIPSIG